MLQICDLRSDHQALPLGLGSLSPTVSWRLDAGGRRGAKQTAYRLRIASRPELLEKPDILRGEWIQSEQTTFVATSSPALRSRERRYWSVQVRDELGEESAWATPSWFEAGLLQPSDWQALWIAGGRMGSPWHGVPAPLLRKSFVIAGKIRKARLYATALGLYRLSINGKAAHVDEFSPGWTDYRQRVRARTYDVTDLIQKGENVLGAILGDGWWCGQVEKRARQLYGEKPLVCVQLEVEQEDGTMLVVASDGSWRWSDGPIVVSDLIDGEHYDARQAKPAWNIVGFNDRSWLPVSVEATPKIQVDPSVDPVVLAHEPIAAVAPPAKVGRSWIVDLGQNFAGRARLKLNAPKGTTVRLRYGEMLDAEGKLYTASLRTARATDAFTAGGTGDEVWEPSFTSHGFRYVELLEFPGTPTQDTICGIPLHTELPDNGTFACSEPLLEKLWQNARWGLWSNSLDLHTDCCQRDERLGWLGDVVPFVSSATVLTQAAPFYRKVCADMRDAQRQDGGCPPLAPTSHLPGEWPDGGSGWSDAMVIVPWILYERSGDLGILQQHHQALGRYLSYLERTSPQGERRCEGCDYGDWVALDRDDGSNESQGATPKPLLAIAFLARSADCIAFAGQALDDQDLQQRGKNLAAMARAAFFRNWMSGGTINCSTQTSHVLALDFDLVPEEHRSVVADRLETLIAARNDHLNTGFLGTPSFLPALAKTGRLKTLAKVLLQRSFPSWLAPIVHGKATTIWERWDSWTPERGFQSTHMNSFNHPVFGCAADWLMTGLAGIQSDSQRPGWRHLRLAPCFIPGIDWVRGSVDTPLGKVESSWRRQEGKILWTIHLPPGTSATVCLLNQKEELSSGAYSFEVALSE